MPLNFRKSPLLLLALPTRSFPDFHLYDSTSHPLETFHVGAIISEPRTYAQVASILAWLAAIESEFHALLKNEMWTLRSRPPGKNVVPNKWVFKTKWSLDGSVEHLKVRLVSVGYLQRSGIDFHEMFIPIIKPSTIHLVVSFN